jgi:hypothetical protein
MSIRDYEYGTRSASLKDLRPRAVASKGGGYCQDPDLPDA